MNDAQDTQIYSEIGYTYVQKYYAYYLYSLKEGQIDLNGEKNRISDDNSLKNKIELTTKKLENDDELRIL
jgi:hypothetical protein